MSLKGEVFLCAGEYSGDLLAADLALALKEGIRGIHFFGVTGDAMVAAGVESLASISALGVMGIWEVAPKLAEIRMLERQILATIDRRQVKAAILVDFPGFHFRLAEQLKLRGILVYQYIAPKVWAWGAGRLGRLRRDFELVLGVLPFEEQYFHKRHVPYAYVGSPHKDRTEKVRVRREELGFSAARPLIAFLPGSRLSEIQKILPMILLVKEGLKHLRQDAQFVVPVAANLDLAAVEASLVGMPGAEGISFTTGMSLEVMAAADVCCVASGTATLECALLGTPMVVVYMMNDLSYLIAAGKVKLPWVSLVNIVLGRKVVSEYIQSFSYHDVVAEMIALLTPGPKRTQMCADFAELKASLNGQAADKAAEYITASLSACGRLTPAGEFVP